MIACFIPLDPVSVIAAAAPPVLFGSALSSLASLMASVELLITVRLMLSLSLLNTSMYCCVLPGRAAASCAMYLLFSCVNCIASAKVFTKGFCCLLAMEKTPPAALMSDCSSVTRSLRAEAKYSKGFTIRLTPIWNPWVMAPTIIPAI